MRKIPNALTLLGLTLALSSCGSDDEQDVQRKTINRVPVAESAFKPADLEATIDTLIQKLGQTEPKSLQLSILLKTLTGYWEGVQVGANRAIAELGVTGGVVAPTEATEEERTSRQIQILQEQRQQGYHGFGVAPMAASVGAELDAAVEAGIPVVTIDSDLPDSKRQLYIGTLNYQAGKTAGETLLRLHSGEVGTVFLLGHDKEDDWPDGYQRTLGAKDVLEASGYTVVVRKTTWTDQGEEEDVAALTEAIETADPPVVGMIGMFSCAYRCAMAAEAAGKSSGEMTIIGFDFEPKTLEYMRSGMMQATHVQRQYYMGYLAPYVLYSINVLGLDSTKEILSSHLVDNSRFNAGLDVVEADQIDEYNSFLDSLGIGG